MVLAIAHLLGPAADAAESRENVRSVATYLPCASRVLIFINNTIGTIVTSLTVSGDKMQTTDKLKTVVVAVACAVTLFAQVEGASGHGPAAKNTVPRPGVYRITHRA
jgi:hypothetical protein